MSYRPPLLAGVLLLLALGTANAQQHHRVLWVGCDQSATESLYDALQGTTLPPLEFPEGTPLDEFVDFLRTESDVDIQINRAALDELGIGTDEPLDINTRETTLGATLRLVLEPMELTYVVHNDKLIITTSENALATLSVAVYPVDDLLLDGDYDALTALITSTIAASSWAENGGSDAEIWPYSQRGALVISQTTKVHEEIAGLLRALRTLPVDEQAKPQPKVEGDKGGGLGGGSF